MRIKLKDISIIPIIPTKKGIVAFCNFIVNDSFKVCDCAIATNLTSGGYRLIYPIKQIPPHNKTVQVFYPINKKVTKQIEKQVIDKFNELTRNK